jgi:hypothetical protein
MNIAAMPEICPSYGKPEILANNKNIIITLIESAMETTIKSILV